MRLRFRKRLSAGPFRVNLTERGFSSVSAKVGPFTANTTGRLSAHLGYGWFIEFFRGGKR